MSLPRFTRGAPVFLLALVAFALALVLPAPAQAGNIFELVEQVAKKDVAEVVGTPSLLAGNTARTVTALTLGNLPTYYSLAGLDSNTSTGLLYSEPFDNAPALGVARQYGLLLDGGYALSAAEAHFGAPAVAGQWVHAVDWRTLVAETPQLLVAEFDP